MNKFIILSVCLLAFTASSNAADADGIFNSVGKILYLPIDLGVKLGKEITNSVMAGNKMTFKSGENLTVIEEEENEPEVVAEENIRVKRQISKCCAEGWISFGASCYYFERHLSTNYTAAVAQCEAKEAKLWVPNTAEEFEAIRVHAQSTPYQSWVGGQGNLAEDGSLVYTWEDASTVEGIDSFPWTLEVVPNFGFNSVSQCIGYMHSQLAQIQIAGRVTLPAKGLVWTQCNFGTGRFAICEKDM